MKATPMKSMIGMILAQVATVSLAVTLEATSPLGHQGFPVEGRAGNRPSGVAAAPPTNTKLSRKNSPAFASSIAIEERRSIFAFRVGKLP